MVTLSSIIKLAALFLAVETNAHPGHEVHTTNRAVKRSFLENSRRSLEGCAAHLEARGTLRAAEHRRKAYLDDLRKKALG